MFKNILIVLAILSLSGCATSMAGVNTGSAGFFTGVWHGFICVFSFIGSLFDNQIAVYQTPNNGSWYNFGFLMGIGAFTSSGSAWYNFGFLVGAATSYNKK